MSLQEIEVNEKIWQHLAENAHKRFFPIYGGAGSGKSHTIAQKWIETFYSEPYKLFLVTRKSYTSLRITAYALIKELLYKYDLPFHENKGDSIITANGNRMLFRGFDDPEKIKSFEANYVWMEEATDFSVEDFMQLNLRLRRRNPTHPNCIYMTFNPVDEYSWLNERFFIRGDPMAAVLHTTYKDNLRFLDDYYIAELERLAELDETFHKIYTLGEWATVKNLIYSN